MENNLEIIQAVCIKANPEIETYNCECFTGCHVIGRPIRLSDVLLAIYSFRDERNEKVPSTTERYNKNRDEDELLIWQYWNLRKDDLTQQSLETLQFIADLLK